MSTGLIILLIIVALIAVLLIAAAFQKDISVITESITINRPAADVYTYAKYLKNSERYNKWVMADPNMKREYRGTDGTIGFVYAWHSKKQSSKGEEEITKLVENSRIEHVIRFEKPMANTAEVFMVLEPAEAGQTRFVWSFKNKLNYTMKVMHLFLRLEKMLAKDMRESLQNLKREIEHNG